MTQRDLAARHAADLDDTESAVALPWFLVIDHPNLNDPIRVVSDYFDYEIDGELYISMPFSVKPLTDSDEQASAELRFQNVDRRIGQALEQDTHGDRATVSAFAHASDDFDLTQDPRVPIDENDLPKIYGFEQYELADVSGDAVELSGRITLVNITQEPYPWIRATADRFPGLFA